MKIYIFTLFLIASLNIKASETVMGAEAPNCVGKPAHTEKDVRCIVFFYASLSSTLNPLGGSWQVIVKKQGALWLVFPEVPTKEIPENTVLYKISEKLGKPI